MQRPSPGMRRSPSRPSSCAQTNMPRIRTSATSQHARPRSMPALPPKTTSRAVPPSWRSAGPRSAAARRNFLELCMPRFRHGHVEIEFLDEGAGEPIVLVHGLASTKEVNWVYPGWVSTLTQAGRRAIALDNRGHGRSTKLYDPAEYHTDRMVEDVLALLDYLELERADLFGYSMGARICAFLAAHRPARARSLILGGLRIHLLDGVRLP